MWGGSVLWGWQPAHLGSLECRTQSRYPGVSRDPERQLLCPSPRAQLPAAWLCLAFLGWAEWGLATGPGQVLGGLRVPW